MKPVFGYLSQPEIERIHQSALEILRDVGMQMPSEEAVKLMKEAGCEVAGENIVKIPAPLVQYAIEKAPGRDQVTLYGRKPEYDINFEADAPFIACMTEATQVIDPHTLKKRPATNEDLARLTRVVNQLDQVRINSALVTPQDVPKEISDWYTWATSLKNTAKHITGAALGAEGVRDTARMAAAAVGGEEAFRQRPFISFWVLSRPPLQVDRLTIEALIEMSRWKIPAIISSGPIVGITSPVTLSGTVAQAHAEVLALLTVTQVASPGAPVVYTSFARSMDMRTGGGSMSRPEFGILKAAMAQMGRFLGLPVRMPAMLRDAKILDAQAGFETALTGLVCAMAADIMDAMQFDSDIVVDFADLVFCNECMGALKRMARDMIVDDDSLALGIIREIGPGGNFLRHKHTFNNFRREVWQPKIFERRVWASWEKDGSKDIHRVAMEKVLKLMEAETPEHMVSTEAAGEIDAIVRQASLDYSKSI